MIRVLCIDDSNKPDEIPADKWVKKYEQYRLTFVAYCLPQDILAISLYEKPLDSSCAPYEYFLMNRFVICRDDWEEFVELCHSCRDLDDVDAQQIFSKCKLTGF